MCLPSSKAPAAPPPPPPPVRPPAPPKKTDPIVRRAKTNARQIASRAAGRQGSLLGGALTADPQNQPAKTLLGT